MKKKLLLFLTIIFFSCQNENVLIGKWEKLDNTEKIKSQIEVYSLGEKLYGKRIQLSETNKEFGWTVDDICWKEIKKIDDSTYSGIRIAKRLNNGSTEIMELDFTIKVQKENLINTKPFYTDNRLTDEGKTQSYIRIK